jgi:hypothetical protein
LAYENSTRQSALDSAMALVSQSLECKNTRIAAIDLKITLFAAMKKYAEGSRFIDSLHEDDFSFRYKKRFFSESFTALQSEKNNDTLKSKELYQEISDDLEKYIKTQSLNDEEFEQIYLDIFLVKGKYLNKHELMREAE